MSLFNETTESTLKITSFAVTSLLLAYDMASLVFGRRPGGGRVGRVGHMITLLVSFVLVVLVWANRGEKTVFIYWMGAIFGPTLLFLLRMMYLRQKAYNVLPSYEHELYDPLNKNEPVDRSAMIAIKSGAFFKTGQRAKASWDDWFYEIPFPKKWFYEYAFFQMSNDPYETYEEFVDKLKPVKKTRSETQSEYASTELSSSTR